MAGTDIFRREKSLRALLHRHPIPTEDEHRRLSEILQIPIEWIHESKAAVLASAGDAYGEYQELLKAGLADRAHRVLVGNLLPEVILRDDLVLAAKLCGEVEGKAERWEYGAKVSSLTTEELVAKVPELTIIAIPRLRTCLSRRTSTPHFCTSNSILQLKFSR